MKIRVFLVTVALAAFGWAGAPASTSLMPIDEVKPGMTGVGRTIFEGAEMQDFKVHILGVLKNVQAPQRNLILARLEGGPLAETGVIAGMSGSPVYIDGRLVGAVSYSIGAFPKEPIAGITPIGEMIDATADTGSTRRASAHGQQASIELPITPDRLASAIRATYARVAMFADRPADVQSLGMPSATGAQMGALLRPIATPLVMTGMGASTSDLVASMFREAGFTPVLSGGSADDDPKSNQPLRPGDPIGVSLLGGDGEMGATGTVTHVDGDRIYAFGHPFLSLGASDMPMSEASVVTVISNMNNSFKLAVPGRMVGSISQDRASGIFGLLGQAPKMIPVKVNLHTSRDRTETYSYEIANDSFLTPLLLNITLFNTITSSERALGDSTISVKGEIKVKGQETIQIDRRFSASNSAIIAAGSIADQELRARFIRAAENCIARRDSMMTRE